MNVPVWVIDTNVLVSAVLTPGGNCDKILRAAIEGKIRLAWSSQILAEYRMVLSRPKFKLPPTIVATILTSFGPATQVTPSEAPELPDPDDEVFLGTALSTPDQILVTGNTAHFPPKTCAPVQILTPAEAVRLLAGG
ncbi:putative toxin-antitoxin system toxin component, PIN family [Ruficoccus sp. ZRK36]|uniref:putative toxin-antitoxin system toxin component, PIN family n=1 Tax=Ruficoccus sp. ZRK36 TaxID=2866311 RepID=UPI001C73585B|nr:putative toxin-antitoxin system toxin component, PIN family [Ruficoccus sp. ZRK36]QYY35262.1 putative toxin-antitoxin system toxin component, PIN family [Ruficoccus sp. ZRK36]